ncbi:helix-turn-helix transcriptional regulator [Thermasporomyces composti]|uniref:Putative DNA-binding transcriptional regulator YafY n=1 Tax=Thermasporomyces composti TaxID=696763 RepID=A0A3D9VDF7_THECX|nr:WYL domain-containing protein [Thermasporomyces composti]REF35331.1 putative DNA-binding transcriptional regulator YafY [Thermasporomyces composti]
MERTQRLLAILVALQANRRMTASELAEQFGVSTRTILRDVATLARADVPVFAERGRYGGITLPPGAQVDVNRLTRGEAEVLQLVGVDVTRVRQLGLEAAARSARQKLAPRVQTPLVDADGGLLPLREIVTIDTRGWFASEDVDEPVTNLLRDLRRGRRLRIRYRASGRSDPREYVVDPYGLYLRGGRWYLIADRDGRPRMFAVTRLHSWVPLEERRRLRPDVTLEQVAAGLVAEVEHQDTVRVTALLDVDTVDIARRILGSRLRRVEPVDGRVRVTVGYDQLDGVRQLFQFADHIEVLDPPEARDLVARLARDLAQRHASVTAASP